MNGRASLFLYAVAAVAAPAAAQVAPSGSTDVINTIPFQYDAEHTRTLQQRLNQKGFSSGHVDGVWGPITSKAVMEYQRKAGLQPTGRLDVATLQALGLLAAAQPAVPPLTAAPSNEPAPRLAPPSAPPTAPPAVAPPVVAAAPPAVPGGTTQGSSGTDAGTGRPEPTPGANSFTESEARRRIESRGFSEVGDLHKDNGGIWRGAAIQDGQHVSVWLDYQGDVGRQ